MAHTRNGLLSCVFHLVGMKFEVIEHLLLCLHFTVSHFKILQDGPCRSLEVVASYGEQAYFQ